MVLLYRFCVGQPEGIQEPSLGGLNSSLSEWIVILEELTDSDSVSHDVVLDLVHERVDVSGTSEINVEVHISGLGA